MSTEKEIKIPFSLIGIQTLEFAMIKELFSDDDPNIELGINAEFGIASTEEHEMVCAPEVSFLQKGLPFLKLKVACFFEIKPEQWNKYVQTDSQSIVFPKGFTDHLLMIATGTLRGVLHAKTEGTIFNQFRLPTINVTALTESDIEIKL